MTNIPLVNSPCVVTVDDTDYEILSKHEWRLFDGYARRYEVINGAKRVILMHRQILNFPHGYDVDHIDRKKLNNQRSNLRPVTKRQNQYNRLGVSGSTSPYKGVSWFNPGKCWRASICNEGHYEHIGLFATEQDAAAAYNAVAAKIQGEFALPNDVPKLDDWVGKKIYSRPKNSKSKYRGVRKQGDKWRAYINPAGRQISLGSFESEDAAALAYNAAALNFFGQKAILNVVAGGVSYA